MVFDPEKAFILCSLVVLTAATPGPDILYILSHSLKGHMKHALYAVGGLYSGLLLYVIAITAGLSALFVFVPFLYTLIKIAGVGYLFYLGFVFFQEGRKVKSSTITIDKAPSSIRAAYFKGMGVSLLNPKTTLFFTALLPQFLNPALGHVPQQLFALGIMSITTGCSVYSGIAVITSLVTDKIEVKNAAKKYLYYTLAFAFTALAIRLIFNKI